MHDLLVNLIMFFFLSKALIFLLSPFNWIVFALLGYFITKNLKWKKRFKWSSLILFIFFTNTVVFSEICRLWEVPGKKLNEIEQHDVAIVLGGMAEYNNDIETLSMRRQADRIWQAINLYKAGKVNKILISGDHGYITERGLKEAQQFRDILINWGFDENDILTEEASKNTHENAAFSVSFIKQSYPELKSAILVTSGMHMKRSLACFEKEGLSCTPFSTDLYAPAGHTYFWDQYFIPNLDNLITWHKLFKEIVGYVVYDVVGYI